ncbi:MAG TPA: HEAT repeat domain-containing protein, partial [Gemmatimonadaceae bacterium]|nr:HEAT repeat domain-containing protein [Gemmatimonadaceae bacterium]
AGPLAAIAESRDFSVAFAALDALALIGEPSVASRIVPLLGDELLQPAAAEALGKLGSEEAVAPLAALLAEPGAPTVAGATALAMLHARLETDYGEGELVADLARTVLPARAAENLTEAMRAADESALASLATVLGWIQGPGIDETLAALLSRHRLRRPIAEVLARRGGAAVPALLGALDGDGETRKAAAAALGRIGSAAAVGPLVALLDDDPDAGVVVAGALGSIGDGGAFEPLLAHLGHPQAAFRQSVVAALNSIGHPEMGRRVLDLLRDPSPAVRESAAKIAGYFGYAEALEPLLALAADPVDEVRRVAVEQLAHLEDQRALAAMSDALERGTPAVRAAAARALAHVPAPDALPRLLAACDDEDPWVRYYAARSAGRHAAADALPRLVALATTDPVPPVRMAAIDALGEIGGARAAAALVTLAGDHDESIARQALEALGAIDERDAVAVLVAAAESTDRERALIALRALARHRDAAAVAVVERVAREGADAELRDAAVETLGTIGGEAAIAALVRLAADPRRGTSVVAALARQDEAQVEWIGRELRAADGSVRCILVEALGRMKHRAASALLAEALHDPAVAVRFAAVQALGRRDLRDVEPGLVAASRDDEDPTVRRAAQRALAR